jgi:methionyl-tRNA synthetase
MHTYLGYTQPLFGSQFTETHTDKLGEHTVLRYRPGPQQPQWQPSQLQPGLALVKPEPLFRKLELSVAAEERARLG